MNFLQFPNNRKSRGFTLIELLVVMVIIVILATFSTIMFSNAKMKARDSRRKQDMKALQAALILYSGDHHGKYPSCASSLIPLACDLDSLVYNPITDNLVPTYIKSMPIEPGLKNNSGGTQSLSSIRYTYFGTDGTSDTSCNSSNTCTNFVITACLENANDPDKTAYNYFICNPSQHYSLSAPN